MGEIWVREFTGGLDSRRMAETTPGGVLIQALNGHITRGGEFEKRAAFVEEYALPAGTVGLAKTRSGILVFGSAADPGVPAGVFYQRLQHPDGVTALADVPSFDLYQGKVYAVGVFANGDVHHFYNEVRLGAWFDGRARATFEVTAGSAAGSGAVNNITVGGVSIISAAVSWATSHAATADAIAAEINSTASSPDYSATAVDAKVVIKAPDNINPEAFNGYPVVVTVGGDLAVTPSEGVTMEGGADSDDAFTPGTFVRTVGSKMQALSGPNWHFSGIGTPTGWTTEYVGAGFVDLSTYESGSEELKALARYQDLLAIFSEANIQVWFGDPDPKLNRQTQVLNNTGTLSPRSVTQFGDSDLFYLDESGLRSLRARDASNAAATTDIGNPIDTLITDLLADPALDRDKIVGLIEPRHGRFWLIVGEKIFVFSFFSGSKVSAWSLYEPGFSVDNAVTYNKRIYLRSGDKIYVYGGLASTIQYDETEAVAQIPYLDAEQPARQKSITGLDVAAQGVWKIYTAMNPNNLEAQDKVGVFYDVVADTTYNEGRIPAQGSSTHFSLIFKSQGSGYARLGACLIHFEASDEEDGAAT